MSKMLEALLKEIEDRAGRATPGPWNYKEEDDGFPTRIGSLKTDQWIAQTLDAVENKTGWPGREHETNKKNDNAAFIASSRTDIPKLIAMVMEMKDALEYVQWPGFDRDHWDRVNRAKDALARCDEIWLALESGKSVLAARAEMEKES